NVRPRGQARKDGRPVRATRSSLLLLSCGVAACSTSPGPSAPPPGTTYPARPISGTVSASTYVAQAASIDLFVVRSSELAQSRSASPPGTPRAAPARPCARWRPTPPRSSAAIWTCFGGCSGLKTEVQPHADIVDAGILAAEQLRVAHVDPARLDAGAAGEAN